MPFPSNLPALTAVRFLLAFGVMLFHFQLQWPWATAAATGLIERARLGVDVFFILSGFVLTHAYREALERGGFDYRRFLVARIARIYPAHLAMLAFVACMVAAAVVIGNDYNRSFYNLPGLVTTLLLVHAWTPGWVLAEWNGPSWSLSAEWFAYLAFPLFGWAGVKLRRRPMTLLLLSAGLFLAVESLHQAVYGDTVVHAEARLGVLRIVPEFMLGVALYRLGEMLSPTRSVAIAAAIATAMVMLALMHFRADDRLIVVAAGPLVLALALLSKAKAEGPFKWRWALLAGEASFALYLVHMPVLIAWKGLVSATTGRASSYILAAWEVFSLIGVCCIGALVLHLAVEQPSRIWIRKWAEQRWPKAAGATMVSGSQPPDV